MSLAVTRRDCLRFAGGGALGLMLSPVPWKVLDDVAIWSQNMPWVPTPPRGEVATRFALCTQCTAGCALRARCVGGVPVALAAAGGALGTGAGLCPIGVAAHHLPYHPARLRQPVRVERSGAGITVTPVARAAVVAALAAAVARAGRDGERVVAIDSRPGRTISWLYRQVLGTAPGGVVLTPPGAEGVEVPAEIAAGSPVAAGIDLERVATLISFGAPLLDGWAAPGTIERLRGRDEHRLRIVQVETRPSRTALAADAWLPARPGSEGAVALALANVLLREQSVDRGALAAATRGGADLANFLAVVSRFTPQVVAGLSGIPAARLAAAAVEIARGGLAVAVAGVDPGGGPLAPRDVAAVWGLNLVLGAFAPGGALVPRPVVPPPAVSGPLAPVLPLANVPSQSVRALIIDSAPIETVLPWPVLGRILVPDGALVVSLSPYLSGLARHADYVVPAPAPFEDVEETLGQGVTSGASWAVAAPLLAPPPGATSPAVLLAELAAVAGLAAPLGDGDVTSALRSRCAAVLARGTGVVTGPERSQLAAMSAFDSPEQLWEGMTRGGIWIDDAPARSPWPAIRPLGGHDVELAQSAAPEALAAAARGPLAGRVTVMPYGWKVAAACEVLPEALSKLYRESGLRPAAPQAALSPVTARACGVSHGRTASLATAAGTVTVEVVVDQAVMPGIVHLATGPDLCCLGQGPDECVSPLDICVDPESPIWRVARAALSEA